MRHPSEDGRMSNPEVVTKTQRRMHWGVGVAALVMLFAGVGTWLVLRQSATELPHPSMAVIPKPSHPGLAPRAEPPLPSSAEMDALLRTRLARASLMPEFATWLKEQDLLRRFVTVVGNVAQGDSPREAVSFLAPAGTFEARRKAGKLVIEKQSYARYDVIGKVVGSLDMGVLVSTYREVRHLAERLHMETARPGSTFDATLHLAFEQVLAVPVIDGDIEVVPKGAMFVYADPKLEGLTAAQKHLLRMGPQNLRRIQGTVREASQQLTQQASRR
ncbi:conserved hypothetical protein [Myxococcus xanthus DK 1622]|uniref:DUF3014 domain-containing protein n=2 Tax=Myxococcaceae TaxID=31 RepID=Q1D3M7_MYXXD|nr:conserved hypothetical protein [Myxococcus xanthus DK 1622]NOJ52604.1 DUF3014 domain-containing protein [Myxococcus xanthus]QPM77142.1 DUF3014 domain-containing protein [Myxococcus xanthus]QVW66211.1 DUF3014 domain-containing protein [Myxococcus xanthus DZ2]UEO07662.1 DUF3014 domain-containing protein [Myxococcus xanthus DZ2]